MRKLIVYAVLFGVAVAGGSYWMQVSTEEPAQATASGQQMPAARQPAVTPRTPKYQMSLHPGVPQVLRIDRLGVRAPVEGVTINTRGEMADPKDALAATWYRAGFTPGAVGNAVLAGHYYYQNKPALLRNLADLQANDAIYIENDQGYELEFRVTNIDRYHTKDAPLTDIFGASDKAQLRIVTCYGKWNADMQQYEERLVATAVFATERLK